MMRGITNGISLRSKILITLLSITLLLSTFSLIFVYFIEKINDITNEMDEKSIPELIWIKHWEEEMYVKKFLAESYVNGAYCCNFMESYKLIDEDVVDSIKKEYESPPSTLTPLQMRVNLNNFMITNEVENLLLYENEVGAKAFLQNTYIPEVILLMDELQESKVHTFQSLQTKTSNIPVIIKNSLWILVFITIISIILSVYASYRISASLTRPVEKLVDKVDQISNGQYGLTVPRVKQIELQNLSNSINQMSYSLKESFQAILDEKMYHEQVLNSLPVGIVSIDNKNTTYTLNTTAKSLLNIDKTKVEKLVRKDATKNAMFWEMIVSDHECQNKKVTYETEDKTYNLLMSHSKLLNQFNQEIGRIAYFVDITEIEKLERRIQQSDKLALVGELAAGAAHEIRNPLAVIHGFISLMNQSFKEEENAQYHIPLLLGELNRINAIIEEMLMLSKPGAPIVKTKKLASILEEILPLINESAENELNITLHLSEEPFQVDPKQMKQVLYNLIRNSSEAMEGKGMITIESYAHEDNYEILFTDEGPGIPEKIKANIFDPFLSSKESGTGLGLTIVQRIIENHNGSIELLSSSESGTTFRIILPLT
ncbi:sensor histidine kinase [Bacillus alkalisoli]|uniref:sensor histidine kinase n=1 Tax=Bacillus alkalisoli TaxID=2011008 RepID=UPI000C234F7B|nr:ATP-binding protein [Bacillus alkalisoli]